MSAELRALVEDSLGAVSAKNMPEALAGFAYDGVLIDPHYPRPRMSGHTEIGAGFQWVFAAIRELNFTPLAWYFTDDGRSASVEVTSRHILRNGRELNFDQCFAVDTRDGKISRWRAYTPYAPNGIGGALLSLSKLSYRGLKR